MTKISQLSSVGDSLAVNDQFLIRDVDDATTPNKSVTVSGITRALDVGSATAPAIAFASDKNTGIYSPGADQVAISTNGAGRLFINSSGQVFANQSQQLSNATSPTLELTGDIVINSSTTGASQTVGVNFCHLVSLANATRPGARIESAAEASYTSGSAVSNDAGLRFYTALDGSLDERLRITSAGLVGIGTSSVDSLLHLATSDANGGYLTFERTGSVIPRGGINFKSNNSGTDYWGGKIVCDDDGSSGALRFFSSFRSSTEPSTALMSLLSNGRLGIGTTSPGAALEINAAASTSPAIFKINTSEVGRWDSSGRLLVGTSTARANFLNTTGTARLQVEGTDANNSVVSITRNSANTGGAFLYLNKTRGAAVGDNTIVQSGDNLGGVVFEGSDGSEFVAGAWILGEVDGTPGANDMPGRIVLSTTSDGASSPTERLRITSTGQVRLAGAGITFNGDTATANELDDYEEGTWTPSVVETTSTASYTTRLGVYTKIGQQVHVGCTIVYTGATGSGGLVINGLPFTSRNTTGLRITSAVTLTAIPLTTDNVPYCEITANSSQVAIGQMPIAGGSLAAVPFDPAGSIFFTISYFV